MTTEYNFFQIDSTGVDEPDLTASGVARSDDSIAIRRTVDGKISDFGAGNVGARMASDLTRTVLDFESKDDLSDRAVITEDTGVGSNVPGRSTNVDHNPYLIGSTVNKTRDEQSFRMGMSDNRGESIDTPNFDVMDNNETTASGMAANKNWPTEGYRSFGGKYDFEPYTGGGIH